jgi:hypothetical protein
MAGRDRRRNERCRWELRHELRKRAGHHRPAHAAESLLLHGRVSCKKSRTSA